MGITRLTFPKTKEHINEYQLSHVKKSWSGAQLLSGHMTTPDAAAAAAKFISLNLQHQINKILAAPEPKGLLNHPLLVVNCFKFIVFCIRYLHFFHCGIIPTLIALQKNFQHGRRLALQELFSLHTF